jgi:hypothetical protein
MKLFINKGQYGWYTTARNYKDKDDKSFVNLHFAKNTEPMDGTECINPIEWGLNCYKGKTGITIFKYEVVDNSNMGGDRADSYKSADIKPEELPFY